MAGDAIHPDKDFAAHLAQGKFMLLRAKQSGQYIFYPRVAEPLTGSTDLEWVEASGNGTVYSVSVMYEKPPTPNYNVALIDLAEGPRMMSSVEGVPPEDVKIGMRVKAKVVKLGDVPAVVFEPV